MDTLARIKALAAKEFSIDPRRSIRAAPLDTLGIDSLSFIEFMFKVEEEFGVSVSDEDLQGHQDARRPGAPRRRRAGGRRQGLSRPRMARRRVAITGAASSRRSANPLRTSTRALAAGRSGDSPAAGGNRPRLGRAGRRAGGLGPCAATSSAAEAAEPRPRRAVRARRRGAGARRRAASISKCRRPRPHRRLLGHRHGRRAHARGELQARLRQRTTGACARSRW